MKVLLAVITGLSITLFGFVAVSATPLVEKKQQVNGHWLTEKSGEVMLNPQTSGLVRWRGGLLTLSDRSADPSQRLQLRFISESDASLPGPDMPMLLSETLATSCFGPYVSDNPDLESLAVDPEDDSVFYMTTEDASYADPMPKSCVQRYLNSGSTTYPTLLVRMELQANNNLMITHIRPIQFSAEMGIGDFPNDGVEALAFGKNRILYLGIEKDSSLRARIFSLRMTEDFWQTDEYAPVSEFALKLPKFKGGRHPINGMDYYQTADGRGFLLVAARNDESLWIVDLAGEKETVVVPLAFNAQIKKNSPGCEDYEAMHNASIEGVAVIGETLWLVNDPWKSQYTKNVKCQQNSENYKKFAPLLFSLPIQSEWFSQ